MSERTFILVGGPDCGKTNYIARLWESIRSKAGALVAPHPPENVEFVEKALEFLLKGEFAPRSNRDVAESPTASRFPYAKRAIRTGHCRTSSFPT
jgi:hypothetical protein